MADDLVDQKEYNKIAAADSLEDRDTVKAWAKVREDLKEDSLGKAKKGSKDAEEDEKDKKKWAHIKKEVKEDSAQKYVPGSKDSLEDLVTIANWKALQGDIKEDGIGSKADSKEKIIAQEQANQSVQSASKIIDTKHNPLLSV